MKRQECVCCVTCDDGGGLPSHLVLVHVLPVVQFPLHQDPGPGRDRIGIRIRIHTKILKIVSFLLAKENLSEKK